MQQRIGNHMLEANCTYNGDCLEVMQQIDDGSIDLACIDPPYGMNWISGRRNNKHKAIENDNNTDFLSLSFKEIYRILKNDSHIYCFCSMHNIDIFIKQFKKLFNLKNILIWEKNNHGTGDLQGSYAPKYEFILFGHKGRKELNGKRDCDIIKFNKTNNDLHPTQKPDNLIRYLIEKSTDENDTVLDCFAGSGTTGVACQNSKRNYILIEKDKDYYDIMNKRLEDNKQRISTLFFI